MNEQAVVTKGRFNVGLKFWVSLGVVLWLAIVIANIPAVWAGFFIAKSGQVGLNGLAGSVWSGRASLASVKIKDADYSLGELTWKLKFSSFLTLKPCVAITTKMDGQQFDGDVCIAGLNSFFVKNVTAIFPATLLKPMLPLAIDGQVSLAIQQASIANAKLASVQARAGWMGARVHNGTNWMSLGGLSADVTDDGKGGLTAHVVDVGSPFHVDLVASLLVPAGGNVKGNLVMTEAYATEINAGAWLSMFATESPRDAQGNLVYALDVNL